jgi:chitinase
MRPLLMVLWATALAGCSGSATGNPDAGVDAGPATTDGGSRDAGHDGGTVDAGRPGGDAGSGGWVLGYWAVWQTTQYPLANVKWSDMTHAALAFVLPRAPTSPTSASPYQTLDSSNAYANLGATGMADFASASHAGGAKALISLGGAGAGVSFTAASSSANQSQFVSDVMAACAQWGYDGVDLDWEDSIDYASFQSLVGALRAAAPPGFVLTAPIGAVNDNQGVDPTAAAMWRASVSAMDQLNVETYAGSGAYPGWVVWYFDPLFGQGSDHPFDVSSTLVGWYDAGIPKSKLGVGVGFYGRTVGPPVTAALQSYGGATVYEDDSTLSYGNIERYFVGHGDAGYTWDTTAKTGYLSWPAAFTPDWSDQYGTGTSPPTAQFLTFEDIATVNAKGQWVKANGYGGVIIWTINEGTQYPYGGDGYANPLLDAVSQAFR